MANQQTGHLNESQVERYARGKMSGENLDRCEEHLLFCPDCRDLVREMDNFLVSLFALATDPGQASRQQREAGTFLDRREEERIPTLGSAAMRWRTSDGARTSVLARVRETSQSGLSVYSAVPLKEGTRVRLSTAKDDFEAIVRYCRSNGAAYAVGLERLL